MRTVLAFAAPVLALTATAPALAFGPNATDFDIEVDHSDVDLSTQKGITVLDERVKTIIRRECANGGRDTDSRRLERACRESAFAAAEDHVLLAIENARTNAVRLASTKPVAPEA